MLESMANETNDIMGGLFKQMLSNVSANISEEKLRRLWHMYHHGLLNRNSEGGDVEHSDVWEYLEYAHGPRRGPLPTVIVITIIYGCLFLSGIFGNVCTCLVIAKNKYMHTATNYYLFNLAIADLLLLVIGLPPETVSIWSAYPWVFGEAFCVLRTMLAEMSTNASILTITAFTIERYVAICYPMKAQTMSRLKRVVRAIIAIWCLALLFSIPLTIQFGLVYALDTQNKTIPESASCGIKEYNYLERTFEVSTFLFFVFPMSLVSVMYTRIAIAVHYSGVNRDGSDGSNCEQLSGVEIRAQQQARARRSVLKMLVAVVVAFFVCWAPFHAQRLMTLYIPTPKWTDELLEAHKVLYYISGVCYFISCTINPILYSIISLKFRQAFKQTVLKPHCCCKHPVRQLKKRPYFSYRFTHKNGYSETSFTSVEGGSPGSNSNISEHGHANEHGRKKESNGKPRSGSGNNCKLLGHCDKETELRQMLLVKNGYDDNLNKADVFVSLCDKKTCNMQGSTPS